MRAKRCDRVLCDDSSLTALTARQIKELKKRNAQLEEENLILKKPLRYSRPAQTKMERLYIPLIKAEQHQKDILIPNLKKDDIVIMDNMRSHHTKMVTQLFDDENISYKLLPSYSPDLNPIEKMWSKMKAFLRKQKVRAVDKLSDAINDALKTISVSDCIGWFYSCGYMQ